MVGHDYEKMCHSTTSNRAAMGVAKLFGHKLDACDMHNSDKVAKLTTGDLVRTKDKACVIFFNVAMHVATCIVTLWLTNVLCPL